MIELSLTNFNSNIIDEDNEVANTVKMPLLIPLDIHRQEGGPKTTQY